MLSPLSIVAARLNGIRTFFAADRVSMESIFYPTVGKISANVLIPITSATFDKIETQFVKLVQLCQHVGQHLFVIWQYFG